MNAISVAHEEHLRRLLDLRAARAELNGRIRSVSEFTDTPSIYSNAFSSPRPFDKSQLDVEHMPYEPSSRMSVLEAKAPMFRRELLNNPSTSAMDLEEDLSRPLGLYPHPYGPQKHDNVEEEDEDVDGGPELRMSLLGPKMRFHSRAPWETGEDALAEEDEPAESATPNRGRGMFAKGFALASSGRRSSSAGRRSGESSSSQSKSKSSFETPPSHPSSPHAPSHTIPQAPLPSNAASHAPAQGGMRNHLSPIRERSHTPTNPSPLPSPHLSPRSPIPHSYSPQTLASPYRSNPSPFQLNGGGTRVDPGSSSNTHPFSNPDLVLPCTTETSVPSPLRPAFSVGSSDSNTTVTESTTTSSLAKSMAPFVPIASMLHGRERGPSRHVHLTGKDISSPIAVIRPVINDNDAAGNNRDANLAVPNGIAGWTDQLTSPSFTLISLEEARAQRSRSATVNTILRSDASSIISASGISSEADHGSESNRTVGHERVNDDGTPYLARARSISAGGKLKASSHSMTSSAPRLARTNSQRSHDSPQAHPTMSPAGRPQIRHKKSGLMRLFNGKEKERPRERERAIMPPVPALSEAYATQNLAMTPKDAPVTPQPTRASPHRVPVPQLTQPSLESAPVDVSSNLSVRERDEGQEIALPRTLHTPKRTPPLLSINTSSHARSMVHTSSVDTSHSAQNSPVSRLMLDEPSKSPTHSAPPDTKNFPVLSLRPVSTLFSAHFAEHIVSPISPSPPRSEESCDPSTSPPDSFTPITPNSSMRSMHSRVAGSPSHEDQSAVVQALQAQIANAKKAWQRQVWELECQVKDLKDEVEYLRLSDNERDYCDQCGRGRRSDSSQEDMKESRKSSVMHRPRARTGAGAARFGSAL